MANEDATEITFVLSAVSSDVDVNKQLLAFLFFPPPS